MNISIQTGEIADFTGDVIVLPSDTELASSKLRIVQEVLKKGGKDLLKEVTLIGFCEIGFVVMVQGYDLKTKHVIFMPVSDSLNNEKTNNVSLHQSLRNAFTLAHLYKLKSIAFANFSIHKTKSEVDVEDIVISISKDFENSSIKAVTLYKF